MVKIYKVGLLKSIEHIFGENSDGWILQEDNDPKHRAKLVERWKAENNIEVLPWPSASPDQNLIENVWRLMKIKMAKKKIRTLMGLKANLTKEWNHLPVDLAENLVRSMRNQIDSLIEADGNYTMY